MKTLSSGALRSLQLALPLLFFLGLPSSPPAAGAGFDDYKDDADVLDLPLKSEAVPPSRAEAMSLLAGICGPAHVQATEKNGFLYCDQSPGYPDEDNAWCGLKIQGVLHGHFTSPRADEAVADYLGGCEPHAHDSGGSILLRKEDGVWRRIAYFPGERAARCLVFPRRDGRDALVCANANSGQGETGANVELRSLEPGVKAEDLLDVHSLDGAGYCEIFSAGERQLHSRFKSWERRPAAEGTPARLVVQVETEDFVTPDFCGKYNRDLDQGTADALHDKFEAFRAEQGRLETVTFDWDGERFLLSSPLSSAALLKAQSGADDADDDGDDDDSDVLDLPLKSEIVQPSLTETRNLLAGICGPAHVQAEKKDGTLFCDAVPGYPDLDEDSCGLDIRRGVLHGHFTSPQADEVVADYTGCEAHVHDYGGSILLRKQNGTWRRIAYFPGERAARCLVFPRRDGRDALVCASAFSGQGDYNANLELRSLKSGVKPKDLFDVHSKDGAAICERFSAGERQIHTRFKGWERQPATQGTPARLVVQVETEDFVTPGFCGKVSDNVDLDRATLEALNDKFDAFRAAQRRRVETVTFDWNGERFVKK